jgi:hypothetical protein
MARKIFVSYKYKDWDVSSDPVVGFTPGEDTDFLYTPRHYVDKLIETIGSDHIYKGEWGDEGMDDLVDNTIHSKLRQKIFDSSITIVLVSPRMWDKTKLEKDQWIPKEISYSLRDKTVGLQSSKTNGILAVILPDSNGSYDYAVIQKFCGVRQWQTASYFRLLRENMFNRKNENKTSCQSCGGHHHHGNDHSYIHPIKWEDFINNHNAYVEHAMMLRDKLDEFDLTKTH